MEQPRLDTGNSHRGEPWHTANRKGAELFWCARLVSAALLTVALSASAQPLVSGAADPGTLLYESRCAMCHDHPQGNIPPLSVLHMRSADYVLRVLTSGAMRTQASGLRQADLSALVKHVTGNLPGQGPQFDLSANRCHRSLPPIALDGSFWNGWSGHGESNTRYQPDPQLSAAEVPRLKLKWAFALPGGAAGGSEEPTIVAGRVFVASASGDVFALDAHSGCTVWATDLGVPSRNSITVGKLPSGVYAAYLGDDRGEVHALDAATGKQLWHRRLDDHPIARITGSVVLYAGHLYVPVSSLEEALAADPSYRCCTFRGSVAALDAATGRLLWKSHTIRQVAKPTAADPNHMAPAGAAVWTTPAIDPARRLIYVATGDAYTEPAAPESDAVLALDMDTGAHRWVRQLMNNDVWVLGCDPKREANCPKGELGPDFDLSGSPILTTLRGGQPVLIVSGKSGMAYGLDPDHRGQILWQARIAQGGTRGGIEWGGATDGRGLYFPISDSRENVPFSTKLSSTHPTPGGITAVSMSGETLWHTPAPVPKCTWQGPCHAAQPGAPALIPGVVFAGSWDGHERAYSTVDGRILWDFDTGRTVEGVNGVKVTGGSIDGGAQTIADGTLFVNSGVRDHIGNALLAFTVDGK